jgi:hypothetical protein
MSATENTAAMGAGSSNPVDMGQFIADKYGRERQADFIASTYLAHGRSVYILGLPGIGKSSFLHFLEAREAQRGAPARFVYLDVVEFFMSGHTSFIAYLQEKTGQKKKTMDLSDCLDKIVGEGEGRLVLCLDHIDGITLEILNEISLEKIEEFQNLIERLKFYCPQKGISLVCCGTRHYRIAQREIQDRLKALEIAGEREGLREKWTGYLKTLRSSVYKMDIFYLTGLTRPEIEAFCKQQFTGLPEVADLAEKVSGRVGNHPGMIASFLGGLAFEWESAGGNPDGSSDDPSGTVAALIGMLEPVMIQMKPMFENLFAKIWSYQGLQQDRDLLCVMAMEEAVADAEVEEYCEEFGKKGQPPAFYRAKINTFESQGLLVRAGRPGDADRKRCFFSDLFRVFLLEHYCGSMRYPGEGFVEVSFPSRGGVDVRQEERSVHLTGKLASLFKLLYQDQERIVDQTRLIESLFKPDRDPARAANSLYQLKRRLSQKLEEIDGVRIIGKNREGYGIEVDEAP